MIIKEIKTALEEESEKVKEVLLSIDSGEVSPESLPFKQNFYATKKERLDALIWILEVESRILNKDVKA